MHTRLLGKDGYEVGEIGLGCWQIGADWGPSIERKDAWEIMSAAIDKGVDFFDTANVYGDGRSETFIGEFIKKCGKPVTVATKFGRGAEVYPGNYSEEVLRNSVDASLKRLQVEKLDLLQLHCIPTDVLRQGEIFHWLRRLKQEGLIRHFGASVETVEEGLLCLKQDGLLSLQVIFNIFRQKLIRELLPQAEARGIGIIVRLPLASGLLTGKFGKETKFAENDHRNYNRDGQQFNVGETFAGLPFEKGVELVEKLNALLPSGMTLVHLALRWILDHPAVSVIIPGASSPDQILSNVSASGLKPLAGELHRALSEFYDHSVEPHIRGAY
jgi:aryl-alcohol dehydrogenase-like predicted oxidoreductase